MTTKQSAYLTGIAAGLGSLTGSIVNGIFNTSALVTAGIAGFTSLALIIFGQALLKRS